MNASELFKSGKLQAAIDAQLKEVKAVPADQSKRLFLFELLAFAGDIDRARRQSEAITYSEMELETANLEYRKLLDAEQARRRLFSDGVKPSFFGQPPEHIQQRLEAINRLREQQPTAAAELLAKANGAMPALSGHLNDKPFDSLRDCDDLFAYVLEVFARGVYYWVPLEQVSTLAMNPPKYPRDLLWVSARLELKDDSTGNVYLPALYPNSHTHAEDQVKLGRATDWKGTEGEPVLGAGARMYLVGDDAIGLLEWRTLELAS
jgi:type VI secretion system protein ImpE